MAGVFVLGMHRSGTSAATRLISLLGVRVPPEDDLVQASEKNPTGYWESMSLVWFNTRVLTAVGSDERCRRALDADPVVVLVNRNPLEIDASARRLGRAGRGRS